MNRRQIIKKAESFVKKFLIGDPGHDWSHIQRLRRTALYMARLEHADVFRVELMALFHDIADWKFSDTEFAGGKIARRWLTRAGIEQEIINDVCYVVDHISFKGGHNKYRLPTIEGKIVQDADRIDALGAIGVARAFAYGGFKQRTMHNPDIRPGQTKNFKQYRKDPGTTINHFYEKILKLKSQMNTPTGKKLAHERDLFVRKYLKQFLKEWGDIK